MLWVHIRIPRQGSSNKYPQYIFLMEKTDENYPSVILKYPPYLFFIFTELEVKREKYLFYWFCKEGRPLTFEYMK